MSGTKEIKDRIASVRDTQKITNAMTFPQRSLPF